MKNSHAPLDLKKIKVQPLSKRKSLVALAEILADPDQPAPPCSAEVLDSIGDCANRIKAARECGAAVILMFGAPLVMAGLQSVVNRLIEHDLVTHLTTDGMGAIHDWEFAFFGRSGESVRDNIATGTFGAWNETGRNIHLALLSGALNGQGFGQSVGQFIENDGVTLPSPLTLEKDLRDAPSHPLAPARAEMLRAMTANKLSGGRIPVKHPHRKTSLLANAFRIGVPLTVHPGIGGDVLATHPMFRGAVIGRAADFDFRLLGSSVERLASGVVLAVNSPIWASQILETSLSCANNLRLQAEKSIVQDHSLFVVDSANRGTVEPQMNQSFSKIGGTMKQITSDSGAFLQHLLQQLTGHAVPPA